MDSDDVGVDHHLRDGRIPVFHIERSDAAANGSALLALGEQQSESVGDVDSRQLCERLANFSVRYDSSYLAVRIGGEVMDGISLAFELRARQQYTPKRRWRILSLDLIEIDVADAKIDCFRRGFFASIDMNFSGDFALR